VNWRADDANVAAQTRAVVHEFIISIGGALGAIVDALTLPGRLAVFLLVEYWPSAAAWLDIDYASRPPRMLFITSLLGWFLLIVLLTFLRRFATRIARGIEARALTLAHRLGQWLSGLRTVLKLRFRRLFPGRYISEEGDEEVAISELDVMVLVTAHRLGNGGETDVASIAKRCKESPARVKSSLKKLCDHGLLANGSSRGRFHVTSTGGAYLDLLKRDSPSVSMA